MSEPTQPAKELYEMLAYVVDLNSEMEKHPTWDETNIAGAVPFYKGIRTANESIIRYITERLEILGE